MKKVLIILLVLSLFLSACGGRGKMIGTEKAIDIAFAEAQKYADAPITKDMAVCEVIDGCYQVTFDAKTEEKLGFSVIVIVKVDGFSGEILESMEAV